MNIIRTLSIECASSGATESFGERLGQKLRGGEVIELISDVGGGKTTLVRGIARGMGSHDHVSSPTFKISNVYQAGNLRIYHYDFYRLPEAGLMAHELHDALEDEKGVTIVEWGDVIKQVLPTSRVGIKISTMDHNTRKLDCTYPLKFEYLFA